METQVHGVCCMVRWSTRILLTSCPVPTCHHTCMQAATYDELVGSEERRHRWRQMVLASSTPRVSWKQCRALLLCGHGMALPGCT